MLSIAMSDSGSTLSLADRRSALAAMLRDELRSIRPDLPETWADGALFKSELGLDSLDLVELVARIEQKLQLMIPDADLPGFAALADLVDYLLARPEHSP